VNKLGAVRAQLIGRRAKSEAQKSDRLEKAVKFLEAARNACFGGDAGACDVILKSMACECGGTCESCSAKESKKRERVGWGMADGGSGYEEGKDAKGHGSNKRSKFAPGSHEPDEPVRVETPKQRAARIKAMKVDPARAKVIKRAMGMKAVTSEIADHSIPAKSFVADMKRKLRIKKMMQQAEELLKTADGHTKRCPADCTVVHGMGNHVHPHGDAAEAVGGSGEISSLLRSGEYSFAGKPVGMSRGDGLYERSEELEAMDRAAKKIARKLKKRESDFSDPEPVEAGGTTKEQSNYRYSPDPARSCGNCAFFREPAACSKVDGLILKTDTCDWFAPKEGSMRESESIKAREAIRAFRQGYNTSLSEAGRKEAGLKARFARELRLAKSEAERREATRRYKAALRRANEEETGYTNEEGDYHQDKAPGPKPRFGRSAADAGD
jgi:hypothetical protein